MIGVLSNDKKYEGEGGLNSALPTPSYPAGTPDVYLIMRQVKCQNAYEVF